MKKEIIPALAYSFLTPYYDRVVRLTTRENLFKTKLIEYARIASSESVLDVGCGTGTLLMLAANSEPKAKFTGLDADPQMLAVAREKLDLEIKIETGHSTDLPFENGAFDCVISSLFFHHLDTKSKILTLKESRRVLKNGGRIVIADWGKASSFLMRALYYQIQILDGFANTQDNVEGRLLAFLAETGFVNCREIDRISTFFGTISIYQADK